MKSLFKTFIIWVITVESRAVLRKYKPRIIAVTGSVGKTSTKDAIFTALAKSGKRVRKSQKSFNSEIGLPLTVLGVPNGWNNPFRWVANMFDGLVLLLSRAEYPEWLVLEVGADRPGDIRSLVGWLKTDIAVITRLPEVPVHVEFFDSAEAVIEEKSALIDTIKPGGALLLYADDERTLRLQHRLPAPDAKIVTFGFTPEADIRASEFSLVREEGGHEWPVGMSARIHRGNVSVPLAVMGTVGPHAFAPLLAAAAVGTTLDIPLEEVVGALGGHEAPPGRMHLVRGIKDTLVIDDTYNASPAATTAALETLALVSPKGRRIAALGDMMELGRLSVEEHRKLGEKAAKCADVLLAVGVRARDTAMSAWDNGMPEGNIQQFEDAQKAGEWLKNELQPGDCVLVKGSQSMRMERVVEGIMAEPERAAELLVRQDAEWKRR